MQKQQKYHHSVTENGNLQLRIKNQYLNNKGKVISESFVTHKAPLKDKDGNILDYVDEISVYTPADTKDMAGWDDRSKDIVAAIVDDKIKADFAIEKQEPIGIGLEEIVTTDRMIEEDGKIAVRRITRIYDEGIEVSKKYHRSWIMPGQDPAGNDVMSKAVAEKIHIPEVIAAYEAKIAESV